MRRLLSPAAALLALAAVAAPAAAQTIAITGGTVYPVSGPRIENGTVLIRDGRIAAVGANVQIPAGAQRIDATGKWVTPGLVNAATHLGLVEIGAVGDTRDFAAEGREGIAAAFRVVDGLNPRSVHIPATRDDGVTSVIVVPEGGLVAGQAAMIDLLADTAVSAMVVRAPLAMMAQLEAAGPANTGARGELLLRLRELFRDVRAYQANRAAYDAGNSRELVASRADLEAMIPVLEGQLPLVLSANKASDIEAALRLREEYDLRLVIAGAAEGWMVAPALARARVPVIVGALNNIPASFATLGARQENAALLRAAGVPVILTAEGASGADAFNARNVRYSAGNAVAYGMSWDDALRAITLAPAEAFGLGDRAGTLQAGRVANVVVWDGDPFEFSTFPEHVFVHGREYDTPDRQRLLQERYRTLPPNYRRPD